MQIRALIFDFDGTILDTETPEFEAWQAIYARYGVELPLEIWTDSIGRGHDTVTFDPYTHLEALLGRAIDHAAVRQAKRARFTQQLETEPVRPGVLAYLKEAQKRGLLLGVASSSDRAWVAGHLERYDLLSFFNVIRCSDDVTRTKPDPELYLTACTALGVAPSEAIAIEDSVNGLKAAQAAGLFAVATPNQITAYLPLADYADLLIPSLSELSLSELLTRAENRLIVSV